MSQDPAVFVGTVSEDGRVHLDNPTQFRNYCKARLKGQAIDLIIAPMGLEKTRNQQAGFHAMITPWAREEGHRIDDLKRDLLRAVFGEMEHVNPITGEMTMVLVEPHTSKLSRGKYSTLIERTLQIAAECGYVLEAPSEYRERKEQERRMAQKELTR